MIHIGNLDQLELPTLLERIQLHKKTGKVIVICNDVQEEIYIHQGWVVAVSSLYDKEPLLSRLLRSGVVSLSDLQELPANIGQIISQSQGNKRYSDVQIAKVLLKLSILTREQLMHWVQQENTHALQHLLSQSTGQICFEEVAQLPSDNLSLFLEARFFLTPVTYDATSTNSNTAKEPSEVPTTPQPSLFKQIKPATEIDMFLPETPLPMPLEKSRASTKETLAPVAPSGFIRLPSTIGRTLKIPAVQATQAVIQRAATFMHPTWPIDNTLTERVPAPPKPSPLFRWETLLIIVVLLIAGLAHGINMFHYPYVESDEGTYLSQAWAIFHIGRLGYYTYFYDHVPGGWIQIALWGLLTGGFNAFGPAIYSGRIFILVLEVGSTFLLYRIARQISGSVTIAVVVCLLSIFSPYGLYFQRRVLLDNIMAFWMLLSISFLSRRSVFLKHVWLSAITLAISVLSKEVTAFIIPVMAYFVFLRVSRSQRWIAVVGWVVIVSAMISLYPLLAILKGELFPTGTLLGGTAPHVSLIGELLYQAGRGKDGGIFNFHSFFWTETIKWMYDDPVLVIGGSVGAILAVLMMKRYRFPWCNGTNHSVSMGFYSTWRSCA